MALLAAGILTLHQGDHAAARLLLEESRALFRIAGDRRGEAWALRELSQMLRLLGDLTQAQPLIVEGLALARAAGDRRGIGMCLNHLAATLAQRGDHGGARLLVEEWVAELRALGDVWSLAGVLRMLGMVLTNQGDACLARAASTGRGALQTLGDRSVVGWTFCCSAGRLPRGRRCGGAAARGGAGHLRGDTASTWPRHWERWGG
jgi:hypothetical protein